MSTFVLLHGDNRLPDFPEFTVEYFDTLAAANNRMVNIVNELCNHGDWGWFEAVPHMSCGNKLYYRKEYWVVRQ